MSKEDWKTMRRLFSKAFIGLWIALGLNRAVCKLHKLLNDDVGKNLERAICKQCRNEFTYHYGGSGRKRKYCSNKCQDAYGGHKYYIGHKEKWAHINDKKEVKDAGASF